MSRNPQFLLRLDEELKKQLHQKAVSRGISLNAQITEILEDHIKRDITPKFFVRDSATNNFRKKTNNEEIIDGVIEHLGVSNHVLEILQEIKERHKYPDLETTLQSVLENFSVQYRLSKSQEQRVEDLLPVLQRELKKGKTLTELIAWLEIRPNVREVSYNSRFREIMFTMHQAGTVYGCLNEKGKVRILRLGAALS